MTDSRIPPGPQSPDDEGLENSRNVLRTVSGGAPIAASSVDFDPQDGLVRVNHGEGTVTVDTGGAEATVDSETGAVTVDASESDPDVPDPVVESTAEGLFRPYSTRARASAQQAGTDPGGGGGGGGDWATGLDTSVSHLTAQKTAASASPFPGDAMDTAAVFARALHPSREAVPATALREPTALLEPLAASARTPGTGTAKAPDPSFEPRVEVDPDTGLVTIEHADGTVSLDPGDAEVLIDTETGEVTLVPRSEEDTEDGTGTFGDDQQAASEAVDTVPPGQVVVDAETGLITIGYEGGQLTLDPTTGETVLAAGDSPVSLDPDTGLLTVGSPEETEEAEGSGEGVSGTDGTSEEDLVFESGDALVTVDPETGLITVDHVGGRISVDPENGDVRVELGDGKVSVDPETGEVTITPAKEENGTDTADTDTPGADGGASPGERRDDDHSGSGTDGPSDSTGEAPAHTGQSTTDGAGPAPGTPFTHHGGGAGAGHGGSSDGSGDSEDLGAQASSLQTDGQHEDTAGDTWEPDGASADGTAETPGRTEDGPGSSEEPHDGADDGPVPNGTATDPARFSGGETEDGTASEDEEDGTGSAGSGSGGGDREETAETDEDEDGEEDSGDEDEDGDGSNEDEDENEDGDGSDKDEDGEDDKGSDEDGSGSDGDGSGSGSGGDGVVKIDLSAVLEFNNTFVTNIQTKVHAALEEMSEYENTGKDHILVGNGALLEPAANLTSKVNKRLSEIYTILASIEAEMIAISDNLTDTAVEFLMLEEDQKLDAQQLAMIFGTGRSTNSYGSPPPGSVGGSGSDSDENSAENSDD